MDSEDRAVRVGARGSRPDEVSRAAGSPEVPELGGTSAARKRETDGYAYRAMVSSARAHERAATLLEEMAAAHPEEAELHLQSAARHRRWAANDRELAQKYAPRTGCPDGP
ncbi:hypothetical protein [Actinomadura chokoriensis]|uniref:Tetratricopeptide repeat protein n=1 Tax=Actinomadura chokoriensis TaxID=454156 RepID=A0ABV4QZ60_9ACTN